MPTKSSIKKLTFPQAAKVLKSGGVVAYPTETFYGLAARADNPQAVDRLFTIKNREKGKSISIIISRLEDLSLWVKGIGKREKLLMEAFWPGPLTIIFKAKVSVSNILTGGFGTLGVRLPSSALARKLARLAGGPITATSANLSGEAPASTAQAAWKQLGERIDGVIPSPKLPPSKGSTIIDVSKKNVAIIRQGDIPVEEIEKLLKLNREKNSGCFTS